MIHRHTLTVLLYELRRNFLRKGYLFATFGLPLLGIVALVVVRAITAQNAASGAPAEVPDPLEMRSINHAGIVDYAGVYSSLEATPDWILFYPDEAAADAALADGAIDVYYIVPADYLQSHQVTLVLPELSFNQIDDSPIYELRDTRLAQDIQDPLLLMRLQNPANIRETNLERAVPEGVDRSQEGSLGAVYIFAIVFMLSIFLTNGYLMQSVIEEKETRLIEILLSSVRPVQILAGKVLALGVLGLLQVVIWLVTVIVLANMALGETVGILATVANLYIPVQLVPLMVVYFIFGYLFLAAAFGAVGAISNSMQEGPQYAVIFVIPLAIPFYLFTTFTTTPNAGLPVFLSIFPLTSPLAMVQRLVVTQVPAAELLLSIALLVVTCAGMFWLAGRLFRVQTLLAGQVPKPRELIRLLRG